MSSSDNPSSDRFARIELFLQKWILGAASKPKLALGLVGTLVAIGIITAVMRLGINSDVDGMVSPQIPYRQAQEAFNDVFPDMNNRVAIIIEADSHEATEIFADKLAARLRARSDLAKSVFAAPIDPFFEQNGLLYLEADDLDSVLAGLSEAAPLIKRLGKDPSVEAYIHALNELFERAGDNEEAEKAAKRIISQTASVLMASQTDSPKPLSWRAMFEDDDEDDVSPETEAGHTTSQKKLIMTIDPVLDFTRVQAARPAVTGIKSEASAVFEEAGAELEGANLKMSLTGDPVLRTEELGSVLNGLGLSLAASLFFVLTLLRLCFGSWHYTFSSLTVIVVTLSISIGFASLIYDQLNMVSVAFAVLLIGLGVDFAIHFGLHLLEAERDEGGQTQNSLIQSNAAIGVALALCAPTSAIAFLSFAPTQFTGMTQLGVISGFGVLVAFAASLTVLPALRALLPSRAGIRKAQAFSIRQRLDFRRETRERITYGVMGLAGLALLLMPFVKFDADPMALRAVNAPSVKAFDLLLDDENASPYALSALASSEVEARAKKAAFETETAIDSAVTLFDFVPDDQYDALDIIDLTAFGVLESLESDGVKPDQSLTQLISELRILLAERLVSDDLSEVDKADTSTFLATLESARLSESAVNYKTFEAQLFRYWPHMHDRLKNQLLPEEITLENLPASITERFQAVTGEYRIEVRPVGNMKNEEERTAFVEAVKSVDDQAAGLTRVMMEAGRVIGFSMIQATIFALLSAALLLYLILRDGALVTSVVISLAIAGVLTCAVTVIIGQSFNFVNVIVIPLLIGIGADSGIHLGLTARRGGGAEAVYHSITPRAVVFSAITTLASFGTLMFNPHRGVGSMGLLLVVALGLTLLCTILVQPTLQDWFSRKRAENSSN